MDKKNLNIEVLKFDIKDAVYKDFGKYIVKGKIMTAEDIVNVSVNT